MKILFVVLGIIGCSSVAFAQGNHTGGGKIREQDLKALMLDLSSYLSTDQGKKDFPEVAKYDQRHPEFTIETILQRLNPVLIQGEVRDSFDADRDCVSHYADPNNLYFICNQNALPDSTFDNQPRLSRFVFHEALVVAGLERPRGKSVPSIYTSSARLKFHKEAKWLPGGAAADAIVGFSDKGPQKCAANLIAKELQALGYRKLLVVTEVQDRRVLPSYSITSYNAKNLKQTASDIVYYRISGRINVLLGDHEVESDLKGFANISHQNFYSASGAFQGTRCILRQTDGSGFPSYRYKGGVVISASLKGAIFEVLEP